MANNTYRGKEVERGKRGVRWKRKVSERKSQGYVAGKKGEMKKWRV